jgi:hypothetical protein
LQEQNLQGGYVAKRQIDRNIHRIWPKWVQTVGAIQEEMASNPECKVLAMCGKCNNSFRVEIDLLVMAYGKSFSLINKHGKCRLNRCDGTCIFMYSAGPTTPMQTMTDRFTLPRHIRH